MRQDPSRVGSSSDLDVSLSPSTSQPRDPGEAVQPPWALGSRLGDGDSATCNAVTGTKQDHTRKAFISVHTD